MNKLALLLTLTLAVPAFANDKCTKPADATFEKAKAKPEAVLEIVAADVAAEPKCACPIVKAAIAAVKANAELQGDIVAAAINAAPDEAAAIKACLPQTAHGKGGKGVVPSGKDVVTKPIEDPGTGGDDNWLLPWGASSTGGIYLGGVAGGGGGTIDKGVPPTVIRTIVNRPIIRRVSVPATRS